MRFLLSLAFWIYLAISSVTGFTGAFLIWLLTLPFDRNGRVLHIYTCWWGAAHIYVNPFWRVRTVGTHAVDRDRAYVMVANHQSLADILVVGATYLPFKWVSKQTVFKVPLVGWNMRLNRYVAIVRGDRASVARMAAECRYWLERKVAVMMFPEGTRTVDGEIGPFKPGAFRLAREAGVPVLPIVLDGTGNALPKHGFVLRDNVDALVHVLPAIDVMGFATDDEASAAVREVMVKELASMRRARAK